MQTLLDKDLGQMPVIAFKAQGNPHAALLAYIQETDQTQAWGRKDRMSSLKQQAKINAMGQYLLPEVSQHKSMMVLAIARRGNITSHQASTLIAHLEARCWSLRTSKVIKGMSRALRASCPGEYVDRMFEVLASMGCVSYPDKPSFAMVSASTAKHFELAASSLKGANIQPQHHQALTFMWKGRKSLTEFQARKATKIMQKISKYHGI